MIPVCAYTVGIREQWQYSWLLYGDVMGEWEMVACLLCILVTLSISPPSLKL